MKNQKVTDYRLKLIVIKIYIAYRKSNGSRMEI